MNSLEMIEKSREKPVLRGPYPENRRLSGLGERGAADQAPSPRRAMTACRTVSVFIASTQGKRRLQ